MAMTKSKLDPKKIPVHVAIIMDGNRRWAAAHDLGPVDGHRQAALKSIEPIVEEAARLGVKFVTFWAFSTENWQRDKKEVVGLLGIFREALKEKIKRLHEKGVRVRFLGDLGRFPKDIVKKVLEGVEVTKDNDKITVTFALNYGGREEILRAVKKMYQKLQNPDFKPQTLNEKDFAQFLDTDGMPDPDLIIRTGGEQRLSGFLPWQSVYAELYFTSILFPDFSPIEFGKAILDYQGRDRRFGGGKFKDYKNLSLSS